jgi:hypothetical protein
MGLVQHETAGLLFAFSKLIRLIVGDPDAKEGDVVDQVVVDESFDRDDLLLLSRWCAALNFSDFEGEVGLQPRPFIGLAFVSNELRLRASRVPSPVADVLKAHLSGIRWPDCLTRNSGLLHDYPELAPHACISEHLRFTERKPFREIADEVELALAAQAWDVTQRHQNQKVEGNGVPTRYVPERLDATSEGDGLIITIGWPVEDEAVVTPRR